MVELFGVDIAKIINDALSPGLLDLTLIEITDSAVDDSDPTASPIRTLINHTGKGILSDFSDLHRQTTTIIDGDREVTIIAQSLDPFILPLPGFRLTISGFTYDIVGPVKTDAAEATFVCQVRP